MGTAPSPEHASPGPQPPDGEPRTESDASFLARYETWMRWPIIVSAVLPLIIVPESGKWLDVAVGVVTWLVFLFDFVVHERRLNHYVRTRLGKFDLMVVVFTAPWFLLPGAQAGRFVVILRLARLARLVVASRRGQRLLQHLGRVALMAGGVTLFASVVAYYAEHPTNSEFATFGDALWWGIVTLTTVGYGDIVPKTATGRWAGVTIMLTGIAVLGVLAGSLASFFRLEPESGAADEPAPSADEVDGAPPVDLRQLSLTLSALHQEIGELRRQVDRLTTGGPPRDRPGEETPPRS
jgi:voltage-gated potassium channel